MKKLLTLSALSLVLSFGAAHAADDIDQFVDDALDLSAVVAFGHDADQRLRAGRADDQATGLRQFRFGIGNCLLDSSVFQRLATGEADIAQELAHAADAAAGGSALRHLVVFDWADAMPDDAPEAAARWPAAWRDWLLTPRALPEARAVVVHRWQDLLSIGHHCTRTSKCNRHLVIARGE